MDEKAANERLLMRHRDLLLTPSSVSNITALPEDALRLTCSFVGPDQHIYVAGTCTLFHQVYSEEHKSKRTTWKEAATSIPRAELYLKEKEEWGPKMVNRILRRIARKAIEVGNVKGSSGLEAKAVRPTRVISLQLD